MDTTQLAGISKTAPYFPKNSADTQQEVLDHYEAFFRRAARLNPAAKPSADLVIECVIDRGFFTAAERAALLAYLKRL